MNLLYLFNAKYTCRYVCVNKCAETHRHTILYMVVTLEEGRQGVCSLWNLRVPVSFCVRELHSRHQGASTEKTMEQLEHQNKK